MSAIKATGKPASGKLDFIRVDDVEALKNSNKFVGVNQPSKVIRKEINNSINLDVIDSNNSSMYFQGATLGDDNVSHLNYFVKKLGKKKNICLPCLSDSLSGTKNYTSICSSPMSEIEEPAVSSESAANKTILNILVKDKLRDQVSEAQVDALLASNAVETKYTVTPFSHSLAATILKRRKTSAQPVDFITNRRRTVFKDLQHPARSDYQVPEFFFTNLRDLEVKYYFCRQSLKLTRTPAPHSSNPLLAHVDVFDVAARYKQLPAPSPLISDLIERNKALQASVSNKLDYRSIETTNFVSAKNLKIPNDNPKLYEPPLLNIEMQMVKFED